MLLKRAIPIAHRLSSLQRTQAPVCVRAMCHYDKPPKDFVYPTMDELPLPCGDWHDDYVCKQRKYNIHLFFGLGFFIISLAVGIKSGLMWCNMFPPEKPGPRPNVKSC